MNALLSGTWFANPSEAKRGAWGLDAEIYLPANPKRGHAINLSHLNLSLSRGFKQLKT